MKKVLTLLMLLCVVCMGAWAQQLPFELSSSKDAADAKWYSIAMSGNLWNVSSESQDYLGKTATAMTSDNWEQYAFCFVSDGNDGFKIYSKLSGKGIEVTTTKNHDKVMMGNNPTKVMLRTDNNGNYYLRDYRNEIYYLSFWSTYDNFVAIHNNSDQPDYSGARASIKLLNPESMDNKYYIIKSAYTNYTNKALYSKNDNGYKLAWKDYSNTDKNFVFKFEKKKEGFIVASHSGTGSNIDAPNLYAIYSPIAKNYIGIAIWEKDYNFVSLNSIDDNKAANQNLSGMFSIGAIANTNPIQYNIATNYNKSGGGTDYSTIALKSAVSCNEDEANASTYNIWGTKNGISAWTLTEVSVFFVNIKGGADNASISYKGQTAVNGEFVFVEGTNTTVEQVINDMNVNNVPAGKRSEISSEGNTITVTYEEEAPVTNEYAITCTGLPAGTDGGVIYNEQEYTTSIALPVEFDANQLSAKPVDGYIGEVSVDNEANPKTITVAYYIDPSTYTEITSFDEGQMVRLKSNNNKYLGCDAYSNEEKSLKLHSSADDWDILFLNRVGHHQGGNTFSPIDYYYYVIAGYKNGLYFNGVYGGSLQEQNIQGTQFQIYKNNSKEEYYIKHRDDGKWLSASNGEFVIGTSKLTADCAWTMEDVNTIPVTMYNIKGREYASFFAPFEVSLPDGYMAYSIELESYYEDASSRNDVPLKRIDENGKIAAGYGAILYKGNVEYDNTKLYTTKEIRLTIGKYGVDDQGDWGSYLLHGSTYTNVAHTATNNYNDYLYTFNFDSNGIVGFYHSTYVNGFKAFIAPFLLGEYEYTRSFTLNFDGLEQTTTIDASAIIENTSKIYGIDGRVRTSSKSGVNIIDGKKVIIK